MSSSFYYLSMAPMKMKRTKPNNNNHKVGVSIKSLPRDLLTDVLARVASRSVVDLFNIELSCKDLFEVGNDDYVLQHACMDSFPLAPWPVSDEASSFLKRCKESGNAEALFRQGMFEYFTLSKMESGLELLKRAAKKEHIEATYVCGIILLLCCSGENERRQALKLLTCLSNSSNKSRRQFRVGDCRKRVKRIVWSLWVHNNNNNSSNIASTCNCWNTQSKRGWEEDDYGDTCSESCFWDREAAMFSSLIRTNLHLIR
ncbi:hypothetical protein ACOSQ2_018940 [Xanthoceras sorbifolium]